jgi:hypothetical protein
MNYNPKTDHLAKWKPGCPSPNPNGRKPKLITLLKNEGYCQSEVNYTILQMLSLTEQELNVVSENPNATILELTISRALLNGTKKGSLYALESLLNRSIGLPKITQDVSIESKEIRITLDLG